MRQLLFILPVLAVLNLHAQDVKSLELQKQYSRHHVLSKECLRIIFNGLTPIDTNKVGVEEFDNNGRIIRYQEFNRRGVQIAEYHYSYTKEGKLHQITLSHEYNNWQEIELKLIFDNQGRLHSRELPHVIPGLYVKETFHYNTAGLLILSEQWYDVKGVLTPVIKKEYAASNEKQENSLSYIYDQRDLLVVEQLFIEGKSDEVVNYNYTFQH